MGKLSWTGFRFELSGLDYPKAKEAGFHWDFKKKVSWTGLLHVARVYQAYADNSAKERFDREQNQVALSKATDANIVIPAPRGLTYYGFQKAGIAFALARRDTLIADAMGLGKSIMSCGIINADQTIKSILVICPASLKINWSRELERWLVRKLTGGFAHGKVFPNTDIVILNYDIAKKFRKDIDKRSWDLAIYDEAHYLKNQDSQRSRAVLGWESISGKTTIQPIEAKRRIALTGTPILNRPIELWPICRVFDPEGLGSSYWNFARTYCLPKDAPILMNDLTERSISDIQIGDKIIGWKRENYQRRLCESVVVNTSVKESELQRVDLDDGTFVICTPDHKWLSERRDVKEYQVAKVGKFSGLGRGKASRMVRILDSGREPEYFGKTDYKRGYLHGFFRGDGTCSKTTRIKEFPFREATYTMVANHNVGAVNKDHEPILRCDLYLAEFGIPHTEPTLQKDNYWHLECTFPTTKRFRSEDIRAYEFFTSPQPDTDAWWAGFLGGIYDAEGSGTGISQDSKYNSVTYSMIKKALQRFSFKFTEGKNKDCMSIVGSRAEWLRFWSIASPSLARKIRSYLFGVNLRSKGSSGKFMKQVVRPTKITLLPGVHKVYSMTTTTGNYIAYGVGSKNCGAWEAPWGWDFSGAKNLDQLQERLRSTFMIRRTKEQVLQDLPPKRRQVIPIPNDKVQQIVKEEKEFYEKNLQAAVESIEFSQAAGDEESYKQAVEKLKIARKVMFEQMAVLRHRTAVAKIPYVIEYLEEAMDEENKIVTFAHHRDVIEAITNHFGSKAVKVYGGIPLQERQQAVDRFQTDPNIKIFVGGIQAAGVGITLTAASLVVFAELSFVPAEMSQAEDRLHRIGQQESVLVIHLCFDESLDASIAKKLIEKQSIITAVIG